MRSAVSGEAPLEMGCEGERSLDAAAREIAGTSRRQAPHGQHLEALLALPLLLFFVLPVASIFLRTSPQAFLASLGKIEVQQAIGISLKTTLIALIVIVLLGTPMAYWLSRQKGRLARALETLVDLPTVLPPSVAGLALLMAFGRRGLLGPLLSSWGIELAFTQAAVVMAQVFVASPYYVRSAMNGFSSLDAETLQAAEIDGANDGQIMRFITLPLVRNFLLSGGVMSWSRALGEFGATILFAGNFIGRTQTMPLAIYLGMESDLEGALALSVILVLISFLALWLLRAFVGRYELS
jgi:molybdate transport system permease protein